MIQKENSSDFAQNIKEEKFALPPFSHLILTKESTVSLSSGTSDSLIIGFNKKFELNNPIYSMKGDTLIIDTYLKGKGYYTRLICKKLTSVKLHQARLDINMFKVDSLNIAGSGSEVDINNCAAIRSLNINLQSKSWLWCNSQAIELIRLNLDESHSEFNVDRLKELKAELRDSSELSVDKVLHSDVRTDETSRYYSR
jgi:hypothetical protein